jgi:hypothetical protein
MGDKKREALRAWALVALWGVALSLVVPCAAQPLGVGVKIPLQAFVFVGLSEHFALEVGLPIGLSVGGLAAVADLKLFFGTYEIITVLWRPFVGAGASAGVHSQGEVLIIEATFQGIAGVEVPIPRTSLISFAEVWLLAGRPLPGLFALGVRYEF